MGSLLSYSGLTTKIRAMQSRLVSDDEFARVSEMTSVSEVVAFLQKKPSYEKILAPLSEYDFRRGDVERLLQFSIYEGFANIYRFADQKQRKYMDLYFKRYEVSLIKRCYRLAFDHRAHNIELESFERFFRRHSQLDPEKISAASSTDELLEALKNTEYYRPLKAVQEKEGITLFDIEMALDMYYFAQIWKRRGEICRGDDLKGLTNAYGAKFDMINLNWICRSKAFYKLTPADVYAMLIPVNHKLSDAQIHKLVEAQTREEVTALLSQTYYARKFEELTPKTIEEMYTRVLKTTLKRETARHPYSVTTIYSYLYQKEHEVDRLTTALECIRYGLEPAVTLQHIMKM